MGVSPDDISSQLAGYGSLADAEIDLAEPTLDDVFLASTGRHLEGGGDQPA